MNKSLVSYSLIFLILVPIFGLNFLISFLSNIFLLIFLIPLLIFLISFIGLNSLKSKVKTCSKCGTMNVGANNTCMNCGTDLNNKNSKNLENASETIIEVKAEEVT